MFSIFLFLIVLPFGSLVDLGYIPVYM